MSTTTFIVITSLGVLLSLVINLFKMVYSKQRRHVLMQDYSIAVSNQLLSLFRKDSSTGFYYTQCFCGRTLKFYGNATHSCVKLRKDYKVNFVSMSITPSRFQIRIIPVKGWDNATLQSESGIPIATNSDVATIANAKGTLTIKTTNMPPDSFKKLQNALLGVNEEWDDEEAPPKPVEQVPGAIRLFRIWRLTEDNKLQALATAHVWEPGENIATFTGETYKEDSGFYGFNSIKEMCEQEKLKVESSLTGEKKPMYSGHWSGYRFPSNFVLGSILVYGKVKVAERGARAEKAVVEFLMLPSNEADLDYQSRLLIAANNYGVQAISMDEALQLKTGVVPYIKPEDEK